MMTWVYTIILCISALLFASVGTWGMRTMLRAMVAPRDPNDRDNHASPTPKGGGVALMLSATGFLFVAGVNLYVIWALIALIIVSFIDDVHGVSPLKRLAVHVVAACMIVFSLHEPVFQGMIPPFIEFPILVVMLVWFINLTNFMDGIDELTCAQTVMMAVGMVGVTLLVPDVRNALAYDNAIIISAVVGFWYFNRHPATIFMGDSGSIPLGAVMGWLLLSMASQNHWDVALILPAYYLTDSGLTMVKRLATGHKPWEAHSEHAYQRYVRSGRSHPSAVRWVMLCNAVILVLAISTILHPDYHLFAVMAAYGTAFLLYLFFMTRSTLPASRIVASSAHAAT
jgi:UDP-N-acetylmuramyl pentapeptide phosphotransferase/UDP-N-acetylglucosamine-1-phosphate transferase